MEPELSPDPLPGAVSIKSPPPLPADAAAPIPPPYHDRSTGLAIFGVLQIVLGGLAALMIPFLALGAFMSRLAPGGAMRPGQFISGVATYAFAAASLITLGIGSLLVKRWAYALTLVVFWYWLVMGVLITVLMTAVLPVSTRAMLGQMHQTPGNPAAPDVSTGVMAVILTVIIVFATVFLVLLPLAFVIFYGRKDVAETCRRRDPVERWTDRAPLPVLGASVVLFTGALYVFAVGLSTPLFPFFGRYLTGIAGAACFFILGALDVYLAVALFRLQSAGWWIAIFSLPIRLLSMAITYARADILQAYSRMGWSDAQLQMLKSNPILRSNIVLWWSLMSVVLFFGYLLWLKRYVKTPATPQAEAAPVQPDEPKQLGNA